MDNDSVDNYLKTKVEFVVCKTSGDYIVNIPRDHLILATKIVVNSENGEVALCVRQNTHVCDECKADIADIFKYSV